MGKMFKTALLGGFRKKDVIEYLDTLGQQRRIESARMDDELAQLEKRNEELVRQLNRERRPTGQQHVLEAQTQSLFQELRDGKTGWKAREALLLERIQELEDCREMLTTQRDTLERRGAALEAEKTALVSKIVKLEEDASAPVVEEPVALSLSGEGAVDRNLLRDLKARLAEILEEIDTLMAREAKPAEDAPETESTPPEPDKMGKKLSSVQDILTFVQARGEHH